VEFVSICFFRNTFSMYPLSSDGTPDLSLCTVHQNQCILEPLGNTYELDSALILRYYLVDPKTAAQILLAEFNKMVSKLATVEEEQTLMMLVPKNGGQLVGYLGASFEQLLKNTSSDSPAGSREDSDQSTVSFD
jgi:hypothetical protein